MRDISTLTHSLNYATTKFLVYPVTLYPVKNRKVWTSTAFHEDNNVALDICNQFSDHVKNEIFRNEVEIKPIAKNII